MAGLKDVAARAGVSISTVRCALYDLGPVRPETRQRVLDAARELAYTPNPFARALVGGRSPLVAMVVPQLTWHVSNVLVVTLHQEVAAMGLHSAFFVSGFCPIEQTVGEIMQLSPQAVILVQVNWHEDYRRLSENGTHLLGIDVRPEFPPDVPGDAVHIDRIGVFRRITEHLLELGHKHIGLLTTPGAFGRKEGCNEALQAAGLALEAVTVLNSRGNNDPGIHTSLERLLSSHPDLTGLVCSTDLWAQAAIRYFKETGRSIPDEYSVTGYSNEPWTQWTTPALTTVDQGTDRLCEWSLEMLRRRREDMTEPWKREMIRPRVLIRESIAAPRSG